MTLYKPTSVNWTRVYPYIEWFYQNLPIDEHTAPNNKHPNNHYVTATTTGSTACKMYVLNGMLKGKQDALACSTCLYLPYNVWLLMTIDWNPDRFVHNSFCVVIVSRAKTCSHLFLCISPHCSHPGRYVQCLAVSFQLASICFVCLWKGLLWSSALGTNGLAKRIGPGPLKNISPSDSKEPHPTSLIIQLYGGIFILTSFKMYCLQSP